MIFAVFSCAFCYRMTTRAGFSATIRKEFIFRHIFYVLVYVCVWLPYLGLILYTTYYYQINLLKAPTEVQRDLQYTNLKNWWQITNFTGVFAGGLLALIRVQEPAMWETCMQTLKCQKEKRSDAKSN